MALLEKSLQTTHSHNGFKSVFSIKSVFFCCSKTDNETKTDGEVANNQIKDENLEEVEEEELQSEQLQQEPNSQEENQMDECTSENQKSDELSRQDEADEDQNLDDNTYSPTDDFDNISEHELSVALAGTKVERKNCGDLRIKIGLGIDKVTLIMTILLAHDHARPSSSTTSIREHSTVDVPPVLAYSVHILVVQSKKQRYKTKMRQGPDPFFNEIIKITKINQDEIRKWCLRFRLYGSFRNSMRQVIGEGFLPLDKLDLDKKIQCDILLMTQDPNIEQNEMNTLIRSNYCKCDSITSLISIDENSIFRESKASPELLVGLSFSCTTGRLSVSIRHGTNFPKLKDKKLPDTFIKAIISVSNGEEVAKTAIVKTNSNPIYEEKFSFQVCEFQLDNTTLTIEGYQMLKFKNKYMFGYFTLGSKVGEEEREHHWKDLISNKTGEEITRMHTFLLK